MMIRNKVIFENVEDIQEYRSSGGDLICHNFRAIKIAELYNRIEIVKFLLENDVRANCCGGYILMSASGNGHVDIVKLLLNKGKGTFSEIVLHSAYSLARRNHNTYVSIELEEYMRDINVKYL